MNHVFAPLYAQYGPRFKNYMDDCLVATKEGEDALYKEITQKFLNILEANFLFLKPSKCLFEQNKIDFLGLRLTASGITIDPAKYQQSRTGPIPHET